jgi:hypothetical protein
MTPYLKLFPRSSYLLLTLGLLLFCAGVSAQTVSQTAKLTWTPPTTREDGSALSDIEIGGYTLYYGQTPVTLNTGGYISTVPQGVATLAVARDKTSETLTFNLAPRAQPYTIYYALTVSDIFGLVSKPGLLTQSVLIKPASAPSAPASLKVNITCVSGGQCSLTIVQ